MPARRAPEERLWVDRYRPKRFMDLIGDEVVTIHDFYPNEYLQYFSEYIAKR